MPLGSFDWSTKWWLITNTLILNVMTSHIYIPFLKYILLTNMTCKHKKLNNRLKSCSLVTLLLRTFFHNCKPGNYLCLLVYFVICLQKHQLSTEFLFMSIAIVFLSNSSNHFLKIVITHAHWFTAWLQLQLLSEVYRWNNHTIF